VKISRQNIMGLIDILLWVALGLFLYYMLTQREHFILSLPNFMGGYEIGSFTPDTCPVNKPDLDAGLCYEKCRKGYHGVGPVCWADTVNIDIGTPVGLEPCPDGWNNDGLTCREPIGCHSVDDCVWHGKCGCWGGNIRGRLDHGGVCPGPGGGNDHTDKVDGLCYKKCPKDLPQHLPGMPYLCYAGGALSYGRGVGQVPSLFRAVGKYTFF
jgi:hypothetical protein